MKIKNDPFIGYLYSLENGDNTQIPIKPYPNDILKSKAFTDRWNTMGFCVKAQIAEKYLQICQELSWEEFLFANLKNALEGKWWYDPKRIYKIAKLLKLLQYNTCRITVHYPLGCNAPVMFELKDTDLAIILAPCAPKEIPRKFQSAQKELPPV